MQVIFIHHSCFLVEVDEKVLIFDWFAGDRIKLVLEAGSMGNGGEIYIFDMGNPVKIVDLARRMIYLSGQKNIKISTIYFQKTVK